MDEQISPQKAREAAQRMREQIDESIEAGGHWADQLELIDVDRLIGYVLDATG